MYDGIVWIVALESVCWKLWMLFSTFRRAFKMASISASKLTYFSLLGRSVSREMNRFLLLSYHCHLGSQWWSVYSQPLIWGVPFFYCWESLLFESCWEPILFVYIAWQLKVTVNLWMFDWTIVWRKKIRDRERWKGKGQGTKNIGKRTCQLHNSLVE